MRIGVPRESRAGETLVAATAQTAGPAGLGYDAVVESGAGAASQPDEVYADAGIAARARTWASDGSSRSTPHRRGVARLASRRHGGKQLMAPARSPELVERLARRA